MFKKLTDAQFYQTIIQIKIYSVTIIIVIKQLLSNKTLFMLNLYGEGVVESYQSIFYKKQNEVLRISLKYMQQ